MSKLLMEKSSSTSEPETELASGGTWGGGTLGSFTDCME